MIDGLQIPFQSMRFRAGMVIAGRCRPTCAGVTPGSVSSPFGSAVGARTVAVPSTGYPTPGP